MLRSLGTLLSRGRVNHGYQPAIKLNTHHVAANKPSRTENKNRNHNHRQKFNMPKPPKITWSTYLNIARQLETPKSTVVISADLPKQQKRRYSTNSQSPNKPSTRFIAHYLQQNAVINKDELAGLLVLLGLLYLAYIIYSENVKKPVIDKSVLRAGDDENENKDLWVIDALTLKVIDHHVTVGRSRGHKVRHAHETEDHRYYYFKEPFDRSRLIKELVVGALGREIFGELFPRVYAVETPINDLDDDSRYDLISESLGEKAGNMNLEQWARLFAGQAIDYAPTHLGTSIAFDMLMGKTDCKLANLIVKRQNGGNCYSIDHETSLFMAPQFLLHEKEGLRFIGEFSQKSLGEHIYEQNGDGAVDTESDNMHQPLRGDKATKDVIAPVLRTAIRNDMTNGKVLAMYEKFVSMSESDLTKLFTRYGTLIHPNEQASIMRDLLARQAATREYLAQFKNKPTQENNERVALGMRR